MVPKTEHNDGRHRPRLETGTRRRRILDPIVDRISGNPLPAVRVAAEGLVQAGKGIHALSRINPFR